MVLKGALESLQRPLEAHQIVAQCVTNVALVPGMVSPSPGGSPWSISGSSETLEAHPRAMIQ
jgi:hypothetical protein